ncbi:MAG: hypothetical protein HY070_09735, partial [Chloroflexi bacterium]|nr:hypothetical protein [Chloroflexota bacterium]
MILHTRSSFFITTFVLYASAIIFATLALNAYFAQTWDAQTFIQAARQLLDGNPFDLYAQSRAAQTWPYAYPPLHAIVVALALVIGDATRILPDFIWARAPALIADIGVAYALYRVVLKKTNDGALARIGFLVGLFNPVTFYNTAVQAHFESEWIFFVLLAFIAFESGRGIFLPTIFLAIAVLFKQTAIVYAMMMWLTMSLR